MSISRRTAVGSLAILIVAITWTLLGVERVVGDHEIGVSWEPFLKHTITWRFRFENPAQKGLDIVPLASLTVPEQRELTRFCEVRFGQSNLQQCHELLSARLR
jgi:hypothetical protein